MSGELKEFEAKQAELKEKLREIVREASERYRSEWEQLQSIADELGD